MEKLSLAISVALGVISIATIVFYAGYNFRTLQVLRKTIHELNNWKQGLMDLLDNKYVRNDLFELKLNNIQDKVTEIYEMLDKRKTLR